MKKYFVLAFVFILIVGAVALIETVINSLDKKEVTPEKTTTTSFVPHEYEEYEEVSANYFNTVITSYSDYQDYLNNLDDRTFFYNETGKQLLEQDFENNNYIMFKVYQDSCSATYEYKNFDKEKGIIYYILNNSCGVCAPEFVVYTLRVDKSYNKETKSYFKQGIKAHCNPNVAYKPLIYIYPEEDMDLTIKLSNENSLLHNYPAYNKEWKVRVSKDSNIYDYNTNRNYYGLYWEAKDNTVNDMKTGFVVSGKDTVKFLEEKLELLGLNEREINEFIVYWIDKLENNKYNYIYFRTMDEMNNYMKLEFSKDPETLIRVFMDFKPLNENMFVQEQVLTKVVRKGYTVVEWGGRML